MLHIEEHKSQLFIDIMNSFLEPNLSVALSDVWNHFDLCFLPASFTTLFMQSILVSLFDRLSDLTNVLTTRFFRFKRHLCLSDLMMMLKESIGLNFFTAFFLPSNSVSLGNSFLFYQLILVLMILPVPYL